MRTLGTRWVAAACIAVTGCGADALTPLEAGGTAGTPSALGGSGGASTGGTPTNGGVGATAGSSVSGAAPSGGSGAGSGDAIGGGSGGGSGGAGGTSGAGGSGFGGEGFGGVSGSGLAGSGGTGIAGAAGSAGRAPTFTEIWNRTLENGCATPYCHDGSGKGWSGFDKATAHRTLVAAASTTCPGETRVVPGNPAESVLAAAISHVDLGGCDVPTMPRDRAKLAQADIDGIIAWISAGARDD